MKLLKNAKYSVMAAVALAAAALTAPDRAVAQELYLGDIMQVGFDYCPQGTLAAHGQLLPIAQNQALFSLLGITYGGDGRTTFGLPDLRGRSPMGQGQGPGLSMRVQGQKGGAESHTLSQAEMPSHSHLVRANNLDGDKPGPGGKLLAAAPPSGVGSETIYSDQPPTVTMSEQMIASAGASQPFDIEDPYLVMTYCVVTQGIFPSRS